MVKLVCMHGFQESHLIGNFGEMGQVIRNPGATFSMLGKLGLRAQHFGYPADKGKLTPLEQACRTVLVVVLGEFGFEVKELQLGRCPCHVEVND